MNVAHLESTIKTQGNQLISSDIKNKSLNAQIALEVSAKETLQQTLATKEAQIEGFEEKLREKDEALGQKEGKIDQLHEDVSQALMTIDQKDKDIKQLKHDMKQIELLAEMSGATTSVNTNISGTMNPKLELRYLIFRQTIKIFVVVCFGLASEAFLSSSSPSRNLRQEKSKLQQQLDNEKRRSVQLQSELADVRQELIDLRQSNPPLSLLLFLLARSNFIIIISPSKPWK